MVGREESGDRGSEVAVSRAICEAGVVGDEDEDVVDGRVGGSGGIERREKGGLRCW